MTDADIRRTIEWVFKVRDEVTPAVRGISKTTEEAKTGMEGLMAVQDSTASSAEALRTALGETRAEATASAEETRRLVREASRMADMEVEIPAPSIEPVMDAVDEARAIVSGAVSDAQDDMAELGRLLAEGLEGPDLAAVEEVIGKVRREASEPYSMAVPDTSAAREEIMSVRAGVESAILRIDSEIEAEAQRAQEKAEEAAQAIESSQEDARSSIRETSAEMDAQSAKITGQLVAIGALKGGVSAMIGGVQQLGIVSDETSQTLGKINAAFGIMAGAAGTIKAIQGAMAALNVATAINASLNSFNAVLQNPAMLAGVGLAAGAALGVAGTYLVMQNDQSSTSTTINVVDGSQGRMEFGAEVYDIVNGGAL